MFILDPGMRPSASDMSGLLEQQEALRVHIEDFQKHLNMNDKELFDELIQKKCLTLDDYYSIKSRGSPCEKGRLLIVKIKDSAPKIIDTFLTLLEARPAYKHLSDVVKKLWLISRLKVKKRLNASYAL